MAEIPGDVQMSTTVNPKVAWTFDVRQYVTTYAKLLTSFTEDDKLPNVWWVLCDDPDPARKGIYFLNNRSNLSAPESWMKVALGELEVPPPPATPAGFEWVARPTVRAIRLGVGLEYWLATTGTAIVNGVEIPFNGFIQRANGSTDNNEPLPTSPYVRFDVIHARVVNGVGRLYVTHGVQASVAAQIPNVPVGDAIVTTYQVNSAGVVQDLTVLSERITTLEISKADSSKLGNTATLTTANKESAVAAINEVRANVGTLTNDQITLKIFKHSNYNGL